MDTNIYMTVSDILQLCVELESDGLGGYGFGCDQAYCLARKGDTPEINHEDKTIDLGLYTDRY